MFTETMEWAENDPGRVGLATRPPLDHLSNVQEDGRRDRRRESAGLAARRKVRAPQGRMPGNARAPRGDGKCSREQTADGPGSGAQARVKGCGKSAPGRWQQGSHGKPHPEQGQIGDFGVARPARVPGRLLEARSDPGPRQMIPPAYRGGTQNSAYDARPPGARSAGRCKPSKCLRTTDLCGTPTRAGGLTHGIHRRIIYSTLRP